MIFVLLMGVSVVSLLLPHDFLGPARNMTQLIALPQWAAQKATQAVSQPIRTLTQQHLSAEQQEELSQTKTGLENENATLRSRIEQMRGTISELSMLRQYDFKQQGVLIPAPVVALDAAPRRDSMVLGKGQLQGVRQQDWVASRMFVQAGNEDGVSENAAVLGHECLIGWIEQTATMTSRVVLLSDAYANRAMRVHIAHFDAVSRRPLQVTLDDKVAGFILRGVGDGFMVISDIDKQFVEAGVVATGDLVTSDADDPKLPQSLVIGEISEVHLNRDKPVVYEAKVRPRYDPKSLSQVLIVDLSRGAAQERKSE